MKNNFKKNGNMRVRFETPEERREIIRILEEQRGFRIEDGVKALTEISRYDTRTFVADLRFKTCEYSILQKRNTIGLLQLCFYWKPVFDSRAHSKAVIIMIARTA